MGASVNDLSLDTETMGQRPGSAIVGIGACFFDTNTSEIGPTFYRAINLATACRVGLTLDPGTVMWWMGQSDEARNAIRFSTVAIETALQEFNEWVLAQCQKDDVRPWTRGPSFDCSLLHAAYRACGMEAPWHYWNERCHRTLTARNPSVEPPERSDVAHRADDDAVHQAKWLIKIAEHHRGNRTR